jgi:hypothetical protein
MSVTYLTTPIAEARRDYPRPGSGMTREGYTKTSGAPSSIMIRLQGEKRWRRLMVWQFSNRGTLFVRLGKEPHVVREEDLPPIQEKAATAHATKKSSSRLDREIAEALAKKPGHATKSGPSWKQIAEDYKRRAKAAREAGGHVKIYPYGAISILPVEGAESDYYYEDWQYDDLINRTKREYKELLKYISIEDLLLAQSQEW